MKKIVVSAHLFGTLSDKDARVRAADSILRFAGRRLPEHHPDADEPRDPVELSGYSTVRHDIVAKPTGCMDCPERSDACGNCKLSGAGNDDGENDSYEALVELTRLLAAVMHLPKYPVLQSRNDGRQYLHLAAPAFRGKDRVIAELQDRRRMSF